MIQRLIILCNITLICFLSFHSEIRAEVSTESELPEIGSTYMLGKTPFKVVGASESSPFEYTAKGDSLQIIVGNIPGTIVIVPDEGSKVKVAPEIPMVWINDKPHQEFVQNSYLKKNGKGKRHLLLEIIRK